MKKDDKIYTGFLTYKDIEFSFVFANNELKLITPPDKSNYVIFNWMMENIGNGAYTYSRSLRMEEDSLVGTCNENNGPIVFITQKGSIIPPNFSFGSNKTPILQIPIIAYFVCRFNRDKISCITFNGPEINHIHPVNQAFSFTADNDFYEKGITNIETKGFAETTTQSRVFEVDGKSVTAKFSISQSISFGLGEKPLTLKSNFSFEFEPCDDYQFIIRLYLIARQYIRYLSYRRNIVFDNIELSAPYSEGKYERFATLYVVDSNDEPEEKALKENRFIMQLRIDEGETGILQDIADNKIYVRHLPISYAEGRHIDAARFVMITAAFEWEFNRAYPDGLPKSKGRKQAENNVNSVLDELISLKTGREKKIFKTLKNHIDFDSLENKIVSVCKELDLIIAPFGKRLYSINNAEMKYADIGKRLSEQRNHFAHGDIDKDFIGNALFDLIFMEYIVYAMQLKYYGISDENIMKSINELFHLNFAM